MILLESILVMLRKNFPSISPPETVEIIDIVQILLIAVFVFYALDQKHQGIYAVERDFDDCLLSAGGGCHRDGDHPLDLPESQHGGPGGPCHYFPAGASASPGAAGGKKDIVPGAI